ncbi:MAG: YoaP domain-containing protein, partial [Halobacteriota archaeon]|nr:YoaP domain-containing protein [Halobacteriota archaeon]
MKGLTFLYSDLCPYTADWVDEMIAVAEKYDLPCEKIKIEGLKQAKDLPTPWGIFSLFYNGEFLTYEVMTDKKFEKLLSEVLKT